MKNWQNKHISEIDADKSAKFGCNSSAIWKKERNLWKTSGEIINVSFDLTWPNDQYDPMTNSQIEQNYIIGSIRNISRKSMRTKEPNLAVIVLQYEKKEEICEKAELKSSMYHLFCQTNEKMTNTSQWQIDKINKTIYYTLKVPSGNIGL